LLDELQTLALNLRWGWEPRIRRVFEILSPELWTETRHNPIALLAVYQFVFTHIFRVTSFAGQSFIAFVAVALWPWLAAQEALQRGTVSLASYSGMIRKVAFPHEIVVFASVAATFALQFAGYLAVLLVLKVAGEPIGGIFQGDGAPGWQAYFAVADADPTARRAAELGGRVVVPGRADPGVLVARGDEHAVIWQQGRRMAIAFISEAAHRAPGGHSSR